MAKGAAPERTYALVVGVDRYDAGAAWDLDGPAADARGMAAWLTKQGVPAPQIRLHLASRDDKESLALPATGNEVRDTLNFLAEQEGDLLLVYWGGHGLIDSDHSRRLFYADAKAGDKQNLDLDDLLATLRTTRFKGFPQQICIVDACANFVEHMRWAHRLPSTQLAKGEPLLPEPEQFVLLAARAGEAAKNLNREGTGQFSQILLALLSGHSWPLEMAGLSAALKARFAEFRERYETEQTPIYWWRRSWQGDIEPEFNIADLLDASIERTAAVDRRSRREIETIAGRLISEDVLRRLYRQSLPSPDLYKEEVTTLRLVLADLSELMRQQGGPFPVALLEFVERLARWLENDYPAEALRLRQWTDRVAAEMDVTTLEVQSLRSRLRQPLADDLFHVLIEVVPDRLDPKRFTATACSWTRLREFEPIEMLPEDAPPLPVADLEALVLHLLAERVPDLLPDEVTGQVLELFLPRDLLSWGVDQWNLREGEPVGLHFQVVVRWRDRARKKTWDLYWKPKWRQLLEGESTLPDGVFWIGAGDDLHPRELFTQLIAPRSPSCIGLDFPPSPASQAEDLLDAMLRSGVPAIFWLRRSGASPAALRQKMADICRGKRMAELPAVVQAARRMAYGGDDELHPGHHLTLLWDDPRRRLPGFSQPVLATPRALGGPP